MDQGLFDYHVYSLRQMLSASIAWQDLCGTTWAAVAAERIYPWGLLPDPGDDEFGLERFRPFAVVGLTEDQRGDQAAGGERNILSPSGQLSLYLTDKHRGQPLLASLDRFAQVVSAILQEIREQAGVNTNSPLSRWTTGIAPRRGLVFDAQGDPAATDWLECELLFEWS